MEYNTPTLGLFFWSPDYIEFLSHLRYYLEEANLQFVKHSKYKEGEHRHRDWQHYYPIALLGGKVEIHFLHYYSDEEAAEKWYRRTSRINWGKLLIIAMQQNGCTDDDIHHFDRLPFRQKFFFTTHEVEGCKSVVAMKEFEGKNDVGDPYKNGHIFYKYLIDAIKLSDTGTQATNTIGEACGKTGE